MTERRASELYFEELGDDFDRFMSSYDVERRLELVRNLIPEGRRFRRALEVGCGTGAIGRILPDVADEILVGDISEKLAERAGKRLGCSFRPLDACHLELPSASFDLVLSSECIEHTPDPREALREMARVVAPGGRLVVTSPNRLWYPLLWVSDRLRVRRFHGNEVWLFPGEAKRILESAGLVIDVRSGCHLFPWQVPLAKPLLRKLDRFGETLYPFMINWGIAAEKRS